MEHLKCEQLFDDTPYIVRIPLGEVIVIKFNPYDDFNDNGQLGLDERPIHLVEKEEPENLVA